MPSPTILYPGVNPAGQDLAAAGGPVRSVNGRVGAVTLAKSDVGLGNVDNTSDADKPVSTAQQTALDLKVAAADLNGLIAAYLAALPTTLPATSGQLWNNGGVISIS